MFYLEKSGGPAHTALNLLFMAWTFPTPGNFDIFHCRFKLCFKEMYSKCHMSLTLEMCTTHEISDNTGNVMCPYIANVHEIKFVMLQDMYSKCHMSLSWKCAGHNF